MAHAIDAARSDDEYYQPTNHDPEKGISSKEVATITEEPILAAGPELRAGHKVHCKTAIIDVLISLLPLYFVAFAALANIRDGTLASSLQNVVVFKMATVNPTLFPIVFTLIIAKLLKAVANWKLERGATVGLIQHLLGSRSLVSSIMTPVKLRTSSFMVPLLIVVWVLNPVGGQMSLRVVSKQSNTTRLDTPFYYLDVLKSQTPQGGDLQHLMDVNFNSALSSPVSAKNGSEDIYSNLRIPLLESLQGWQVDSEGWIDLMGPSIKGIAGVVLGAHNRNSTTARRIGLESWLAYDNFTDDTLNIDLSEAWCDLTTTYVEVEAYCQNQLNCTVSKLRRSKQAHPDAILTVFDGTHLPAYTSPDDFSDDLLTYYGDNLAPWWFGAFVNSTRVQPTAIITYDQTPLEAYFHDTVTPHVYAVNGNGGTDYYPQPIHDVGPELFSTRLTQLLNTYWLSTTAPFTVVGGVSYRVDSNSTAGVTNSEGDGILGTSKGSLYVETIVLRCHKPLKASSFSSRSRFCSAQPACSQHISTQREKAQTSSTTLSTRYATARMYTLNRAHPWKTDKRRLGGSGRL